MPITSSVILGFGSSTKLPVLIETNPSSINVGQAFDILLFSPEQYTLDSPYYGIINGGKSISPAQPERVEVISVSGSAQLSVKYPVAELVSVMVANALVSDAKKTVVYTQGENIKPAIDVVNGALIFKAADKFYGSLTIVYKSFNAQIWTHKAFDFPGAAVLYASASNAEVVNLSITEQSQSSSNLLLEAHDRAVKPNTIAVRLLPVSNNIVVKANKGTISEGLGATITRRETLTFNNESEKSTQYPIFGVTGLSAEYFVDAAGKEINVNPRAVDGKIKTKQPCSGSLTIEYQTVARILLYSPEVSGTNKKYGRITATDKTNNQTATYDVQIPATESGKEVVVAKLYREVLVTELILGTSSGRYELPDIFGDAIAYSQYPSANTSTLDSSTPRLKEPQAEVYFYSVGQDGEGNPVGMVGSNDNDKLIAWEYPTSGAIGLFGYKSVAWKIDVQMPAGLGQSDTRRINEEIDRLKAKYKIK